MQGACGAGSFSGKLDWPCVGLWLRGRASDWQSEGRGFESRQLHFLRESTL